MTDLLNGLGLQSLALFAATVFIVNATPGVDMLLAFTSTMKHGVRGGLATSVGIAAGCLVHTALVVVGVAALIAASPLAYRVLQWAGALYLVWLAVTMVRDGFAVTAARAAADLPTPEEDVAVAASIVNDLPSLKPQANASVVVSPTPAPVLGPLMRQGFMTNVLNPKVALFFLALLPQFVATDAPRKSWALALLGVWFALQGLIFLFGFVGLVSQLRRWQPTPARRRWLHVLAAFALLWVAARLLLTSGSPVSVPLIG